MKLIRKIIPWILLIPVLLCAGVMIWTCFDNQSLPTTSAAPERLDEAAQAHLAEAIHLRQTKGNNVWPGWGDADIPIVLYNETYAYLINDPDNPPPAGWTKIPQETDFGGPWEAQPGVTLADRPVYRLPLPAPKINPQSFTVKIGDRWAGSMATFEWMKIHLRDEMGLPEEFQPYFPYTIIINLLVDGSDAYIPLLEHESFHAYQGMVNPERVKESERLNIEHNDLYPRSEPDFRADWQEELDLLQKAVHAGSQEETTALAQQFFNTRRARRTSQNLSADMIKYEQEREWLEGLAKYVELTLPRTARADAGYQPAPAIAASPDFHDYANADQQWDRQINQISRMAENDSDTRFYYSGLAQAVLLDRLLPGWKERILTTDLTLEELLHEALTGKPAQAPPPVPTITSTPPPPPTSQQDPTATPTPLAFAVPTPGMGLTGQIITHKDFPSQYVDSRTIAVWLPPAYDQRPDRRYPVLYMHDGQNVFDPTTSPYSHKDWAVDEMLTYLIEQKAVTETIVVAVWTNQWRTTELVPQQPLETLGEDFVDSFTRQNGHEPQSDAYLKFLVEEVKPFIDKEYRTLPDRDHTFLMGASLGGMISVYALCEYPEVFGGIAGLSTHWPILGEAYYPYLREHLPDPATHHIYLDYGTETLDAQYEPYQQEVDKILAEAGYQSNVNWITRKFPGDAHTEAAWRNRVYIPLLFLLGTKE